jgi:hypothetical protein
VLCIVTDCYIFKNVTHLNGEDVLYTEVIHIGISFIHVSCCKHNNVPLSCYFSDIPTYWELVNKQYSQNSQYEYQSITLEIRLLITHFACITKDQSFPNWKWPHQTWPQFGKPWHAKDKVRGLECLDPKTNWMGSEILTVITYLDLFTSPLWTQITGVRFFQSYYIYSRAHIYKDCA